MEQLKQVDDVTSHCLVNGNHMPPLDEEEEREHFQRIVNAYRCYQPTSLQRCDKTISYLNSLSESHQEKLVNYRSHLERVKTCIEQNAQIVKLIIGDVEHMFDNIDYSNVPQHLDAHVTKPSQMDIDKVQNILKQIAREWSSEGAVERTQCFQPILDEIDALFGDCDNMSDVSILVPGAGLGRLAYEIARRGFTCQGNEYSLFMLFASNFILNKCKEANSHTLYPWVHQYHNNLQADDQIAPVAFPDSDPSAIPKDCDFSMAAGNFTEIYTELDKWDCVATCFFIDTAPNIAAYVETIWQILKPGGVWINFGPLLYHYADLPTENSIEPSYDFLKQLILSFGFELLREELNQPSHYTHNKRSMLIYQYHSIFFVFRKPDN